MVSGTAGWSFTGSSWRNTLHDDDDDYHDDDTLYTMMMMMMTMTTTRRTITLISMAHIWQFSHQYFLFKLAALISDWEAAACSVSAQSPNSESFWSLSNTLSTLTHMMSTTSSTWFCVCWSLGLLPEGVLGFAGTPVDILPVGEEGKCWGSDGAGLELN